MSNSLTQIPLNVAACFIFWGENEPKQWALRCLVFPLPHRGWTFRVLWLEILAPLLKKKKKKCPRNCLQTEPISCCFNTQNTILTQDHKVYPRLLLSDEGHYESGIKSTIHGIGMKLSVFLNSVQIQQLPPWGLPNWQLRWYVWIV